MISDSLKMAIEKATEFNLRLDKALRETGVVDRELFTEFAAVQSDPNASSVGWLEAKLRVLYVRVSSGAGLSLYEPSDGTLKKIETLPELLDWANEHFPIIHWLP